MTTVFTGSPGRASVEGTSWLSGYGTNKGTYGVARVDSNLAIMSKTATPARLHAVIKHPFREEVCVPARRPGTQCIVLRFGEKPVDIFAQKGRHYYGHGTYSSDGTLLYLSENDFDNETGVIGVYNRKDNYKRLGEFSSGGIGPHEILLAPDRKHLVVANGGIITHPASGRAKLNLDTMSPSLSLINIQSKETITNLRLKPDINNLSIRHLCQTRQGTVYFGVQDQYAEQNSPSLVGCWDGHSPVRFLPAPAQGWTEFKNYIGSVTLDQTHSIVVAVSPRGGIAAFWDCRSSQLIATYREADICGISSTESPREFILTSGNGNLTLLRIENDRAKKLKTKHHPIRFDNHCTLL